MDITVLTVISIALQIFSLSIGVYYLFVGLAGFLPVRRGQDTNDKIHTFALIISAHNEEKVIANMVHSLNSLDYPKEAYDIIVIADNCTDNTASEAEKAGANVYIRNNPSLRGKGYALEWIFEKLYHDDEQRYDYISVFDADNLVDKNYLTEMNKMANQGYTAVQGFLDSKNPYDSWISAAYSYCFWTVNRIFQQARYNLGLCCELSGTGFIIAFNTLQRLGWGATCLTEDMEFTMKLALNDEKVAFAYNARVYDEKPLTLKQSWTQRVRWMRGHCDVASRYFTSLIKKGIKERKLSCIDCAVYLVQPIRIISVGIITFFAYAQTFFPSGDLGFIQLAYLVPNSVIWTTIWNIIAVLQLFYTPFVVWYERREISLKMIFYYFTCIIYNFSWVPIAVQGMIEKNKTEWAHTEHTRSITLEDMTKSSPKLQK